MSSVLKRAIDTKIKEVLGQFADKIETYAVEYVIDNKIVAWGHLQSSIHVKLNVSGEAWELICYAEGTSAPYAGYVHEGREAGKMPPIAPLMAWAKRKGIVDAKKSRGSITKTKLNWNAERTAFTASQTDRATWKSVNAIAWAIAKKIEKEGIPAKPFFEEAVKRAIKEM